MVLLLEMSIITMFGFAAQEIKTFKDPEVIKPGQALRLQAKQELVDRSNKFVFKITSHRVYSCPKHNISELNPRLSLP